MYKEADKIKELLEDKQTIVIIQADNPDADSLGSALAMEQILAELKKDTHLYCGVDMPAYLRYMSGWDRVSSELPNKFDASVIVDASTMTLLEKIIKNRLVSQLSVKPCIVLDHHAVATNKVPFTSVEINDSSRASAGELIYLLAKQLKWSVPLKAQEFIMSSILGDTQGLTNQLTSAQTYKTMAELVEAGVDRPRLEEIRREYSKMPKEIYKYKAELINRTEFAGGGKIAYVTIPQKEINSYSPLYNPAPLIQGDMLQTLEVKVAIVFKSYDDGKVTAAIRCNPSAPIAAQLAEKFGGGGHKFASGFKTDLNQDATKIRQDCLSAAEELINNLSD